MVAALKHRGSLYGFFSTLQVPSGKKFYESFSGVDFNTPHVPATLSSLTVFSDLEQSLPVKKIYRSFLVADLTPGMYSLLKWLLVYHITVDHGGAVM